MGQVSRLTAAFLGIVGLAIAIVGAVSGLGSYALYEEEVIGVDAPRR